MFTDLMHLYESITYYYLFINFPIAIKKTLDM
jgi:hypothetical protein